jgi:hypothetical protein
MHKTSDAGPRCSGLQIAAVVIALATACAPACAQMRKGANGGQGGGDKRPTRGLLDQFKDQVREKQRQLLRRLRVDADAKGDAKAAQEALREMGMLYHGGIRAPEEAATDLKEGGAPEGVVQPGVSVAEREHAGPALAASAPVPGQQADVEQEAARLMAVLGLPRDTVATLPAAPPESQVPVPPPQLVAGVPIAGVDEVAVMVAVPALRANGSMPLIFQRERRAGPDLPDGPMQDPVAWGVPIFGFAVEAAGNATSPRVPVFAVPVDWLDGWDGLEATLHVMANQWLGTYRREGILYTASGQARLYRAPPKNLSLRKPPREHRLKED